MYGRELEIAPELIYVELWAETGEERERVVPVEEDPPRRRARVPDLLAEQGARGLLVLGEAGAGKTALVSWLATRALAEGKRVPLVLPLASLALRLASEPGADLVAVAAEIWARHGAPGLAPVFSAALERGEAWILFDGLDEAGDRRQRQEVAQRIADFVRGSGANAWLVTSRPGEERDSPLPGPAPLRATLCAWEETEVEGALLGWCRALERWRVGSDGDEAAAGERARRLRDQIFADGALRELASRPLSLAMLVLIERAHQKLPEHRVLLYRAFADELLARRPGGATRDEAVEFLIELALWIHQKHPLGRVHAETLAEECVRVALREEGYTGPEEAPATEVALARERAGRFFTASQREVAGGILHESEPGLLSFSHRGLREFFLGRALARMTSERRWELLRRRLHARRWREPLLLCVGWLALVERRRDEIDRLLQQVLGASSPDEVLLARDLRLAVEIAASAAGVLRHQRLADLVLRAQESFPGIAGFIASFVRCQCLVWLARSGASEAEGTLRALLVADEWSRKMVLRAMQGALFGVEGRGLRALALEQLESDDPEVRHLAWHALLPLWNLFNEVGSALLRAFEGGRVPTCAAVDRDLARRLLEGPAGVAEVLSKRTEVLRHCPSLVAELWWYEDVRRQLLGMIEAGREQGLAVLGHLAARPLDPELRALVASMLAHADPEVRLKTLETLAQPRRASELGEYVRGMCDDPDSRVSRRARELAALFELHGPEGARRAAELLRGTEEERKLVAENLRAEWWSDPNLRPRLLELFSPSAGKVARVAFRAGFQHIFAGQAELAEAARVAFVGGDSSLQKAILDALGWRLAGLPDLVDELVAAVRGGGHENLVNLIIALRWAVDRSDVSDVLCELIFEEALPLELRRQAIGGLAQISRHEPRVYEALKRVVEGAHPDGWVVGWAHDVLLRLAEFLPGERIRRGVVSVDGRRAGLIEETSSGFRFTYDAEYLSAPGALAVSLTLPLRAASYESERLHPFFDNMLPEGWLLDRVSRASKIDRRDRLGILLATAGDAIGAVSVVPDETEAEE